jgi:hypothetical protein
MKTTQKISTGVFVALIAGAAIFNGCKKDSVSPTNPQSTYNMYMTDAPAVNYSQVNVNIVGAQVNSETSGWVNLNVKPRIYNLLTLCGGKDTLLATGMVSTGNVSQVRLILGATGNTVMVGSTLYPLSTPSDQQSGLKVNVNSYVAGGAAFNLLLDFDAGMSVVASGSGSYILKPVIRANVAPTNGGIKGVITEFSSQYTVMATNGTDTSATYSSAIDGRFEILGLASGTYNVLVVPQAPYTVETFTGVIVSAGQVTNMGSLTIE